MEMEHNCISALGYDRTIEICPENNHGYRYKINRSSACLSITTSACLQDRSTACFDVRTRALPKIEALSACMLEPVLFTS